MGTLGSFQSFFLLPLAVNVPERASQWVDESKGARFRAWFVQPRSRTLSWMMARGGSFHISMSGIAKRRAGGMFYLLCTQDSWDWRSRGICRRNRICYPQRWGEDSTRAWCLALSRESLKISDNDDRNKMGFRTEFLQSKWLDLLWGWVPATPPILGEHFSRSMSTWGIEGAQKWEKLQSTSLIPLPCREEETLP